MRRILVATLLTVGLAVMAAVAQSVIVVDLIAGQHINVGTITVFTNGAGIVVVYDTGSSGWGLEETHLYVGTDEPAKAAPGRFPYKHERLGGATNDEYFVPLDEDLGVGCGAIVYLATHAVVSKPGEGSETAWGDGERFAKNWAMCFPVEVVCEIPR